MLRHHNNLSPAPIRRARLLMGAAAIALMAAMMTTGAATTMAATEGLNPSWRPQVSERLVKLPANYLKKSLDRDFARSPLGQAIRDLEKEAALKAQTLSDLQKAIEQSEGDVQVELKHQLLAEKHAYIELMADKQELHKKQVKTRQKVLERLLAKLNRKSGGLSEQRRQLVKKQDDARRRFSGSASQVDMALFADTTAPQTKYAKGYSKNLQAIQALMAAIKSHPMNAETTLDGEAVTKPEYVRRMIADSEAEVALIEQEGEILGYMAKIVALDAMVLSEEIADSDLADSDVTEATDLTSVVNIFIND